MPLKTYLPDGDIDLTVLTKQNMDDDFYGQLCSRLQNEERESEFHATDVQFIPAQVSLFIYFLVSFLYFLGCPNFP